MSRLLQGVTLILLPIVINSVIAIIATGASSTTAPPGCTDSNNFTTCEQVGKTDFLAALFDVTVSGIEGLPTVANFLYVLIMAFLLVAGVLLVVLAFVPLTGA